MTNIKFLLLGTSLSFIPTITFAQCVATQDCETLGYTETSCNGGKGIKCPFGNLWACLTSEEECLNLACNKLGFSYTCTGPGEKGVGNDCNGKYQGCTCDSIYQYTCSGAGYSGGSGAACNGKYTSCTCANGYKWNGSSCQQVLNGAQDNLYYYNGTVVGVKSSRMEFYVAMQDLGRLHMPDADNQCSNYVFCGNLQGTLPSKEQLQTMYNNKSAVNELLLINNGMQLKNDWYWSSSHDFGVFYNYYKVNMYNGSVSDEDIDSVGAWYNVRPVLTSW